MNKAEIAELLLGHMKLHAKAWDPHSETGHRTITALLLDEEDAELAAVAYGLVASATEWAFQPGRSRGKGDKYATTSIVGEKGIDMLTKKDFAEIAEHPSAYHASKAFGLDPADISKNENLWADYAVAVQIALKIASKVIVTGKNGLDIAKTCAKIQPIAPKTRAEKGIRDFLDAIGE